tara:strand:+ start:2337 stop:2474 length:138 start_codon:yes stop_codon:yes gene_type:complete
MRFLRDELSSLPVLQVALQHGYDSQSAFAAAFRRQFGVTPSALYR